MSMFMEMHLLVPELDLITLMYLLIEFILAYSLYSNCMCNFYHFNFKSEDGNLTMFSKSYFTMDPNYFTNFQN